MKKIVSNSLFGLVVGFFLGYVVIAVGIGTACPSLYKVASPVFCSGDQHLEVVQNRHSWRPGATMWTATIYVVDPETEGPHGVVCILMYGDPTTGEICALVFVS